MNSMSSLYPEKTLQIKENYYPKQILWQPTKDGHHARILRVFGQNPLVRIPDRIEGRIVTEIGPYCFSSSDPQPTGEVCLSQTRNLEKNLKESSAKSLLQEQTATQQPDYDEGLYHVLYKEAGNPALCGNFVEQIYLPASITTLHNAAFYNCRKLRSLSVGPAISGIGSDEFTNCGKLTKLILRCHCQDKSGLSLILERIATDLEVFFMPESEDREQQGLSSVPDASQADFSVFTPAKIENALFFPEYYEWLDEISPAHIFSRSIEGEGFRMRKCFVNKIIDYNKYDQCFEIALSRESTRVLCKIAIDRLQWPNGLNPACKTQYETFLAAHLSDVFFFVIDDRNMSFLRFLCSYFQEFPFLEKSSFAQILTEAISRSITSDWGEGTAFLMIEKRKKAKGFQKTFTFDAF